MTTGDVTRFWAVDEEPDPGYFIRFVDAMNALATLQQAKTRTFQQMRLAPGHRVLEVGCGTGDDVRRIAVEVGPSGSVLGVDASQAMLDEARRRAEGTGLAVEFQIGDACALDIADASFDSVRAERVLIHIPEPRVAVAEMARVTRPGGRVVLFDVDFESFVVAHPDPALVRRMVTLMTDAMACGRVGRLFPGLLADAGLEDIDIAAVAITEMPYDLVMKTFAGALAQPRAAGAITVGEWERFWAGLEETYKTGRYLVCGTMFMGAATKPA